MTRDETDSNIKQIEKVLPENHTHLLLIVDDLPEAWGKYKSQVVNVHAYHFWKIVEVDVPNDPNQKAEPNSEDSIKPKGENIESKNQQMSDQESDTSSVSSKEIEIAPKRSEIQMINLHDCYLHFLGPVLEAIHEVFFGLENQSLKNVVLTDFV